MASTLAGVARSGDRTPAPTPPPRGGRSAIEQRNRVLAVFSFPSLLWYILFTIGPLLAMFVIAFLSWGRIFETPEFNGLANFTKLIGDERVTTAARNTAVHLAGTLPFQTVGSFMIGYFLSLKPPGHRVFRVVLFIPALISLAQLGTIFTLVGGPAGLVNSLLDGIGLGEYQTAWFADNGTAMFSLILVSIWTGMGFNAVLFAARLGSIDHEIYSAAELDGANHWQRMWRVAFPISIDYFGVITMLQYLWTLFGTAGLILILTKGGPGQATSTLSWLVYRFAFYDTASLVGYSQAIGILLFVLGVVGLVIVRRVFRQRY